eukprot:4695721-Pyramimonas_sp.AAC.1
MLLCHPRHGCRPGVPVGPARFCRAFCRLTPGDPPLRVHGRAAAPFRLRLLDGRHRDFHATRSWSSF